MATDLNDYTIMDAAEQAFAAQAGAVFAAARKSHLAMGHDVVIARGDAMYRLTPDGACHFIRHITPPRKYAPGTKIRLR